MLLALMLVCLLIVLLSGFPVAFVLSGIPLLFAGIGVALGVFDSSYLYALPTRIYGIMQNDLLLAVPLFVFMGVMLERSRIAEELLQEMAAFLGKVPAGLGLSVIVVGALLAASTGIVGATVVTMGLISLPSLLKAGYDKTIACGTICAAGTLGQVIPPSIVLILLGDQISNAYQAVQLKLGNMSPIPVSVADLFIAALIPGLLLVLLYMIWLCIYSKRHGTSIHPPFKKSPGIVPMLTTLVPPLLLIILVLGSILGGVATATESAGLGAAGSLLLAAWRKRLTFASIRAVMHHTVKITSMVFTILIGATIFAVIFRGYGGDNLVHGFLATLPGGLFTSMVLTMLLIFLLGFILDFIEIIFVVVPIIAPILLMLGADPLWLAVMLALNLQTSFLTPPFGFALFYLKGVAPKHILSSDIYKGILPFVAIQLIALILVAGFPVLATFLPKHLYGDQQANQGSLHVEDDFFTINDVDF